VISAVGNSAVPNFGLSLSIVYEFRISFSLFSLFCGNHDGTANAAILVEDGVPLGLAVTTA